MKYALIMYSILLLSFGLTACSLTATPDPVQEGIELSAVLAGINQNNVKAINEQYYIGFKSIAQELLNQELAKSTPNPTLITKYRGVLQKIEQFYQGVKQRAYPPVDFQITLLQVLLEWAKEPGIELSRLSGIVTNGTGLFQ